VAAVTRFARGIGAARSGDAAAAEAEVSALAELQQQLRSAGDAEWAARVEAQRLAVAAWAARARGQNDEAVKLAHSASELEETIEKHPITPGPLLPARELEGDLLAELGRFDAARAAYEQTLTREPRRARALAGAARAAERAGDAGAARRHYTELLAVMRLADAGRPEPVAARKYLGR
jgi:tetratricopeptide (TPR) repeat protein